MIHISPTVSFQVVTSPSPLTVNPGGGQRGGRLPSWQENCFLQLPPLFLSPFSMLQQIQITAPCPVSSETGFFLQPSGGDEVLDGALDGGFGQTCIAGNGWDGWETGTVLVAPLAEVEVNRHRAGREVLLVEYPALPQRYSSASPFHRQLEQHGRVSVVTFGNNKFGQTPAIVLRGGCPYLFHCLRFQP